MRRTGYRYLSGIHQKTRCRIVRRRRFAAQRLSGDGKAFVHAGGAIIQRTLRPNETLRVDTGCLVAFQPSVDYDIQFIGGFKNVLFGGEGLFYAKLAGPGIVFLQSLPFVRLADRIMAAAAAGAEQGTVVRNRRIASGGIISGRD
ncbi:MAG: AIM24 family protein [Bacteroidia bacterium]